MATKLTEPIKLFIVQSLAKFLTPTEVAEAVNLEFAVVIPRQNIRKYNPEQNPKIALKWKEIFEQTRKQFLENVSEISISQQAYRLNELQRMYHQAGRNLVLKKAILEQAAKECGGLFTNKRDITTGGQQLKGYVGIPVEDV